MVNGAASEINGGIVAQGERWFYRNAAPSGKEGFVVTTGGTVGSTAVTKEFGSIAA